MVPDMTAREVNFDGLVGPTHNYAGLSYGNVASSLNAKRVASPRQAALEGLSKMLHLFRLGVAQAVLPPQERPYLPLLRGLGFRGSDAEVLREAQESPVLLASACSASSMWTANAATVAPSADSADGRVHFTPANLGNKLHRSIEPPATGRALQAIFSDDRYFAHHPALPTSEAMGDEGAANHTRFASPLGSRGVELFVYGRSAFDPSEPKPSRYPARHTKEAAEAIVRSHRLDPAHVVLAAQNPAAIDAGVFHNDVISVGHENVFLHHELAFADTPRTIQALAAACRDIERPLVTVEALAAELPLPDVVSSYLFNSQIVTLPDGRLVLIAPTDVEENARARAFVDRVLADPTNPLDSVHYLNLRQSMQNGGGPACLRLRVVLTEDEMRAAKPGVFMSEALGAELEAWIKRHYRDRLAAEDLADAGLIDEGRRALDELTGILGLGSIYEFQT